MESIYLLIPVALLLVAVIIGAMFWAIRSGQFDDLEGPAHQILWDDDDRVRPAAGREEKDRPPAEQNAVDLRQGRAARPD